MGKSFDLSESLEDFATSVILLYDKKPLSFSGEYLAKQGIRSSYSVALNYAEALGAGSIKDKTHKLRLCIKELRESLSNLNVQKKSIF
ncbi:four helix bundle protein [Dokdonia ponticola]|uniref:Four helix bundle protein n=1 Tax=Dokdonia ponticola TaxID=2041041 RepID=A0ABV9HYP3_9FLAO